MFYRTQTAHRPLKGLKKCRFLFLVTLTCDLDLETPPIDQRRLSCEFIANPFRIPRYFIHKLECGPVPNVMAALLLVKQQYLLHMSHTILQTRPSNCWDRFTSFGNPSKFQRVSRLGFVTAATSLTGGQPNFARPLVVSWAGTLCIHFRGLLPPDGIDYVEVLCSPISALQQRALAEHCGVVQGMELLNFRRGRHLYSAGRPSCWASAHILVRFVVDVAFKHCSSSP